MSIYPTSVRYVPLPSDIPLAQKCRLVQEGSYGDLKKSLQRPLAALLASRKPLAERIQQFSEMPPRPGLMQRWPLLTTKLLDYAARWHPEQEVISKTVEARRRGVILNTSALGQQKLALLHAGPRAHHHLQGAAAPRSALRLGTPGFRHKVRQGVSPGP